MELAARLFKAMPVSIDGDSSQWNAIGTKVKLRGNSSIMGIPLPNNGQFDSEYYFNYYS